MHGIFVTLGPTPSANKPRNSIVLVFDGLSPGFLGPYGNTWVESSAFNQLAADGVLIEHAVSDCPVSAVSDWNAYRGFWDGQHSLFGNDKPPKKFVEQCRQLQIKTNLITDQPEFAAACGPVEFDVVKSLPAIEQFRRADELSETRIAQLISEVVQTLDETDEAAVTWVHAASLVEIWDAPLSMIEELRAEDDPEANTTCKPPNLCLDPETDPDVAWGWSVGYAAQVRVIDACLSVLLSAAEQLPNWDTTLMALTATHGFPLGEHGALGASESLPHSELINVPLIVRYPDQLDASVRLQSIMQSSAIFNTLAEWFGFDSTGDSGTRSSRSISAASSDRQVAVSRSSRGTSIRTPAWLGIQSSESGHDLPSPEQAEFKLYAKPDDRWDFNEVAQRCPAIVELLREELAQFETALRSGTIKELAPLHDSLVNWRE